MNTEVLEDAHASIFKLEVAGGVFEMSLKQWFPSLAICTVTVLYASFEGYCSIYTCHLLLATLLQEILINKYRVIKKSFCTYWLQYRKLQVIFKVSPASLQTFIDTPNCVLGFSIARSKITVWNCLIYCIFACFCTVIVRCTETFWSSCTRQYSFHITLRRVRENIVTVEKQWVLHVVSVCF